MRISHARRYALGVAMLAGCGGGNNASSNAPMSLAPLVDAPSPFAPSANRYKVLHSFGSGADGRDPVAALTIFKGALYGTTTSGGSGCGSEGCGTVFEITTSGAEHAIYRFQGEKKGADPAASVIAVKGVLYGSTYLGGSYNAGTFFGITPAGKLTVFYGLPGCYNACGPVARLTLLSGELYGTTFSGGGGGTSKCEPQPRNPGRALGQLSKVYRYWCGTVFRLTTSGQETLVYAFQGGSNGAHPASELIALDGSLFGTTEHDGANNAGTVFTVTPAGAQNVLYSFQGGNDGDLPFAALLDVKGTLYGTTAFGGSGDAGTVFKITSSGQESVLYSFKADSGDGENPQAGLINVNGTLYGTTVDGGANCGSVGCGTVFAITTSGKETVLHNFKGYPSDGNSPYAGLINVDGTLYGTTTSGGANNEGTVFSISP